MTFARFSRRLLLILAAIPIILCLGVEARVQETEDMLWRYRRLSDTMHRAKQAMIAKDWEKAITLAEISLVKQEAIAAEAYYIKAMAYWNQEDVKAAKEAFRKCSGLKGGYSETCKEFLELLEKPWPGGHDPPPELRDPLPDDGTGKNKGKKASGR